MNKVNELYTVHTHELCQLHSLASRLVTRLEPLLPSELLQFSVWLLEQGAGNIPAITLTPFQQQPAGPSQDGSILSRSLCQISTTTINTWGSHWVLKPRLLLTNLQLVSSCFCSSVLPEWQPFCPLCAALAFCFCRVHYLETALWSSQVDLWPTAVVLFSQTSLATQRGPTTL